MRKLSFVHSLERASRKLAPNAPLACALVALLTALLRMQYVVHVLAFSPRGMWVVHVGGDAWESAGPAAFSGSWRC